MDSDGVNFVETAEIFKEVGKKRRGQHFGVEGSRVLHLLLPHFVNGVFDECDTYFVDGFVDGAVVPFGGVFRNSVLDGLSSGVRCDVFFGQRQLGGDGEGDAVLGVVCVVGGNDAPEVVIVSHCFVLYLYQIRSKGMVVMLLSVGLRSTVENISAAYLRARVTSSDVDMVAKGGKFC